MKVKQLTVEGVHSLQPIGYVTSWGGEDYLATPYGLEPLVNHAKYADMPIENLLADYTITNENKEIDLYLIYRFTNTRDILQKDLNKLTMSLENLSRNRSNFTQKEIGEYQDLKQETAYQEYLLKKVKESLQEVRYDYLSKSKTTINHVNLKESLKESLVSSVNIQPKHNGLEITVFTSKPTLERPNDLETDQVFIYSEPTHDKYKHTVKVKYLNKVIPSFEKSSKTIENYLKMYYD